MSTDSPSTTDRLAEAPNPHIFRLWEELGTGLMEVECEAPDCDWKATFNPPITAAMKAQAIRVQREHREFYALSSLVDSLRARLDTAKGQLATARDLHTKGIWTVHSENLMWDEEGCVHCRIEWPCPTAEALGDNGSGASR